MGAPTRARWQRRRDLPGFVAMGVLAGLLLSGVIGLSLGAWMSTGRSMTPVEVGQGFMNQELEFSGTYFAAMALALGGLAVLFLAFIIWWKKTAVRAAWVDVAAQHMASPKEAKSLSRKAVLKKAQDLGVKGTAK
ncbi:MULTISPECIES: hypothetical protein [Paenarthrobacter]|uniref:Uncharacterized protein n=1 Tax=Paenarthrobacter ureafaciens TaxID=37931 RepID=A0AAX3EQD6_PAEUR|nr:MULTISPECIES: hypothetical protein [Paenarthrobacter]MDO5867126.1 hypothetical protein [Paenarthrobacter sp. SD-2]MDO5878380.1 hypothetical protein [Paenarthrobacter sp. SD-1]UYV95566.1 hypothetical protein NL395_23365 [Paenarthrobacter ureafaciens]UYW00250.1 hypothetical protein NL394_24175 [Paenarthrobacter ureafaciens]